MVLTSFHKVWNVNTFWIYAKVKRYLNRNFHNDNGAITEEDMMLSLTKDIPIMLRVRIYWPPNILFCVIYFFLLIAILLHTVILIVKYTYKSKSLTLTTLPKVPSPKVARILSVKLNP